MIEWLASLPKDSALLVLLGMLSVFLGNVVVQWLKNRNASELSANDMTMRLLAELRADLDRLKESDSNYRKALDHARALARHLELVLGATTDADRKTAENTAKLYLDSIRTEI